MKKNLFKSAIFVSIITIVSLSGCKKSINEEVKPPVENDTRWISLTAALPDGAGVAGNGGTLAYAISVENAANPNYEVKIFQKDASGKYNVGYGLKSQRTARVQASEDGKYLYNIQYTGAEGGVFNKYKVSGEGKYEEVGFELNTSVILGTSPRWTKVAEGLGVGVSFGDALPSYTGTAPNYQYQNPKGKIRIANIDLNNTAITNTGSVDVNLGAELEAQGYHIWRADVPILNQAKNKLFIGLGVRRHDLAKTPTVASNGTISWPTTTERTLGTLTLVVDYPTLRNPKIIASTLAKTENLSYRTMTQYLGNDGHVYQAATGMWVGHQILRISKETNDYDNAYEFNLNKALNVADANIQAWKYIKDGIGIVMYTLGGKGKGGYLAIVDLNTRTASKLTTALETDVEFGNPFEQYQNIGVNGDYVYVPLTPSGKDGNLYVINWKTKEIKKGAKLINQSGSFYIGAY